MEAVVKNKFKKSSKATDKRWIWILNKAGTKVTHKTMKKNGKFRKPAEDKLKV